MNFPLLTALLLAAAVSDDPADLLPQPPLPPKPRPPPGDPDEVRRLVSEGTEAEIGRYRRAHLLSPTDDRSLLQRLDDLDLAWSTARLERLEAIAREHEAKEARLRAERQAARAAAPVTPLSVRCPRCCAKPGKRCHGANTYMDQPHPERVRAAKRRSS